MKHDSHPGPADLGRRTHEAARLSHLEAVDTVSRAMDKTLDASESVALGLAALRAALNLDCVALSRWDDPGAGQLTVAFVDAAEPCAACTAGSVAEIGEDGRALIQARLVDSEPAQPVPLALDAVPEIQCTRGFGTCRVTGVGLRPRGGDRYLLTSQRSRDTGALGEPELEVLVDVGRRLTLALGAIASAAEAAESMERAQQLAKMNALGSIMGGVAHHFNNLLAGMLGNIYVLEDRADRDPAEADALADIRHSGEQAARLVRQLMTFARKGPTSVTKRDLVPLVRSTVETLDLATPRHIRVNGAFPAAELVALVDVVALQDIVLNLVTNARQALDPNSSGTIEVELGYRAASEAEAEEAPHGWASLSVTDDGVGIAPSVLPHIFEPFFTTRKVGAGVGLGLSTVYGAVGRMGGDVHVESEVGRGTRVEVRIPIVVEAPVHTPPDSSVLPGHGETILLVDDDETVRTVLTRVLTHLGYVPVTCGGAEEAIAAFKDGPKRFAAVLTDVVMPHTNGYELARALRAMRSDIPVLLMTSYDPEGLRGLAEIPGDVPRVLEKPLNLRKLAGALARALH